jgi:hypothetical protein
MAIYYHLPLFTRLDTTHSVARAVESGWITGEDARLIGKLFPGIWATHGWRRPVGLPSKRAGDPAYFGR